MKGMLEFWSNLLNNETLDENLIGEINEHLRKDENYNFQTSPDFQKSPSYLLTPMHQSGELPIPFSSRNLIGQFR